MNKTVLIPDDLYTTIQNTDIIISGSVVKLSMAKKIKLFFDVYVLEKMIEEGEETLENFKTRNRKVLDDIKDESIRNDKNWINPGIIK